jgi:hypothetical protein
MLTRSLVNTPVVELHIILNRHASPIVRMGLWVKSYERVGGPKVMEIMGWSRRFVRVQGRPERERVIRMCQAYIQRREADSCLLAMKYRLPLLYTSLAVSCRVK